MLLAWFEKSTTLDFTVQDLITEMKTWFTEGFLYDDVWETEGVYPPVYSEYTEDSQSAHMSICVCGGGGEMSAHFV